mmetsp:Transcript_30368/g.86962  ORF Transcript_30368/g.86962 Transcript_30368/m.86962 type:complete len:317 (-) Transcript_30368:29-979(-)
MPRAAPAAAQSSRWQGATCCGPSWQSSSGARHRNVQLRRCWPPRHRHPLASRSTPGTLAVRPQLLSTCQGRVRPGQPARSLPPARRGLSLSMCPTSASTPAPRARSSRWPSSMGSRDDTRRSMFARCHHHGKPSCHLGAPLLCFATSPTSTPGTCSWRVCTRMASSMTWTSCTCLLTSSTSAIWGTHSSTFAHQRRVQDLPASTIWPTAARSCLASGAARSAKSQQRDAKEERRTSCGCSAAPSWLSSWRSRSQSGCRWSSAFMASALLSADRAPSRASRSSCRQSAPRGRAVFLLEGGGCEPPFLKSFRPPRWRL